MAHDDLYALAASVITACLHTGCRVVTAESCTGGLIAAALTEVAGASQVVERGYVTYSNRAKEEDLGVPAAFFETHGAVSGETAAAMVKGALARSPAEIAVAVTGIAGPGGGTIEKPVGLVYLGWALRGNGPPQVERQMFSGDRVAIREATVRRALQLVRFAALSGNL